MPRATMYFLNLLDLALLALLIGWSAQASAQSTPITAYYPNAGGLGPANAVLTINVLASVGGSCGFAVNGAPNATVNAGAIDATDWTQQVPFTPECTAPWRIAISSANGALASLTPASVTGFRNTAPYTVGLHVVNNGGVLSASCPVAQLSTNDTSGACNFKGTASPTNGLQVPRSFDLAGSYLAVGAPAFPGPGQLVAGDYSDTLTVTVSPSS